MDITIIQYERWNPRQWDNYATIISFSNNVAGDKHDYKSTDYRGWNDIAKKLKRDGAIVIRPLFVYDHGNIELSTQIESSWPDVQWDLAQIGFAVVFHRQAIFLSGWSRISAKRLHALEEYLQIEVEEYAKYVAGEPEYSWQAADGTTADNQFSDKDDAIEDAMSHFGTVTVVGYEDLR